MSDDTRMPDHFDRLIGQLDGLPGVFKTKPSTFRVTPPLGVGGSKLYIIQTIRQVERVGDGEHERTVSKDTIFLEVAHEARLALPPEVADAIARQRQALTDRTRARAAKAGAATRRARGYVPNTAHLRRRRVRKGGHS